MDWSHRFDAADLFGLDDVGAIMEGMLKALPLDFNLLLPPGGLPNDVPKEFKELIVMPTTLYEFFHGFMDFTDALTDDQKRFKVFVQYLHRNSLTAGIYAAMGIEGYDGIHITDKDKLRESYGAYFTKTQKRTPYELFMDMYYGLETFGFVRGKPKKQKMMNLINDSRHAFFGAWCDVVVSKDADFRAKTGIMYSLHDIETKVIGLEEFESALEQWERDAALTVEDLIRAASDQPTLETCIREEKDENSETYYFALPSTYLGYFDLLGISMIAKDTYTFFTKKPATLADGTFVKEIAKMVNNIQAILGLDAEGRAEFHPTEIVEGKWAGRYWMLGEHVIQLNCPDKLFCLLFL